ncbi:MAG: class I adenylate-forming enzyme family protein [Acidimicrobiales bacterium]
MTRLVHQLLAAAAERDPGGRALVAGDTTLTYAELDRASDALAATLQRAGVRRGDRVAVMADNSAEVVTAVFAAAKAGGVFVVVNPTTKADKLAYILGDCGVGALVAHRRLARVVGAALATSPGVGTVVWVGGVPEQGAPAGADACSHLDFDPAAAPGEVPRDPGLIDADLAAIIYTSGSTGAPKGVMLTHRNVRHNAWSISTYLGLRADDVIGCVLPLSFDYGLFQVFMAARVGATLVVERSFAYAYEVLERLGAQRATVLPGVPTIFATILQLAPLDKLDLSSLRLLTNTAAALPPAHIHRLREQFPGATVFSMYGLTECTRVSYLDPDRLDDKITSVGRAMPNTEAYVVDDEGRRLPPGVTGELVVRGASVMRGYWGKPEETARMLRDGEIAGEKVLHTGDRFTMDDEGFLYFVGRTDDVFKCKGEKVSPKEVEHVLYELDDVTEAAVVGVPDEIDGTAVKAVVALRPGATLTAEQVRRHCRARLEGHLVPRHVEVRDALPKTETGKIRRAALR